jgi:hypothetical protein
MSEQDKYEQYLQGFANYLNKVANKAAVFSYLDQRPVGDEIELAPVLFLPIMESLLMDSVISLAKLYEPKDSMNLNRFLNFVESNLGRIVWQGKPVTRQQIEGQRQLIASQENAKANVLAQRNKYYAHHDPAFFTDSEKLHEHYPVTLPDVIQLIRTAHTIIGDHSFALHSSRPFTLHEFYVIGLDNMFHQLREHHRNHARNERKAEQIVGPERGERVSQLVSSDEG